MHWQSIRPSRVSLPFSFEPQSRERDGIIHALVVSILIVCEALWGYHLLSVIAAIMNIAVCYNLHAIVCTQ